jgi:hypothetical protein
MATTSIVQTEYVPYRLSLETAGFLTLLLGAWGGIVPFVGPIFGFSADGSSSWTWNLAHALLFLAPGATAVIAGLLIIAKGRSPRRRSLVFCGLIAAAAGAWFVVGPLAWPVLEGTAYFHSGASALRELAYWIGYSLGTGGLLVALGSFVLGRPRTDARLVSDTPVA